jgi:hypothetical protein
LDLREDPVFEINSYNWITFGTCEFVPRRRAGYLYDAGFFKREVLSSPTDDDKDNNKEASVEEADDHDDEGFDDSGTAWDPEHQPPDLNQDKAIQLAIDRNELDQ